MFVEKSGRTNPMRRNTIETPKTTHLLAFNFDRYNEFAKEYAIKIAIDMAKIIKMLFQFKLIPPLILFHFMLLSLINQVICDSAVKYPFAFQAKPIDLEYIVKFIEKEYFFCDIAILKNHYLI